MNKTGKTWVLVLAGGEGARSPTLSSTADADVVPTQFCSLQGGPPLLIAAFKRACAIASNDNVCATVATHHRQWWEDMLGLLPAGNFMVQPENRGTANGILMSLLHILARDPQARIVLLPSDHYVQAENVLTGSLRQAIALIESGASDMLLLGAEPEAPDTDLNYILPSVDAGHRTYQVSRLVRKPHLALARNLIERGALWSTFIIAASGAALLRLFERSYEEIVIVMRRAVQSDLREPTIAPTTMRLFEDLPILDFSRDMIEGQEANFQVMSMLPCGWSDLGAPGRLIETLHRFECGESENTHHSESVSRHNLAAQYELGRVTPRNANSA